MLQSRCPDRSHARGFAAFRAVRLLAELSGRELLGLTIVVMLALCPAGCGQTAVPNPASLKVRSSPSTTNSTSAAPRLSTVFDLGQVEEESAQPAKPIGGPIFAEVAQRAGLAHVYSTGNADLLLMVQPTGGGCGWIDYDGDGFWDLYLNQGGDPSSPRSPAQPSDRLFRNLGDGVFLDVTRSARIDERDYSQGVAVGDFDNDGFDDIFVTNAGADTLFHNQGDGTFIDVTRQALKQPAAWSSSAAWGDVDRDGDLDLYVCRYVAFDRFHPQQCRTVKGERKMCQPNDVEAIPDEFYLNDGDGTFREVSRERGLFGPGNKALGVAIADFDNDGWPDIYVANDATPNFLFVNQRDGQFRNSAVLLGCAITWAGTAQASMGIAVGDYDRNGSLDLYLTHYEGEWNTLYRNLGTRGFFDVTAVAGGVEPTLPMVGFGAVMEDFDQDGNVDLIVANGHLDDPGHLGIQLAMKPQLFTFLGPKLFECSERGGDFFSQKFIGRGLSTADYDRDGDLDVVVVNQNAPTALLQNNSVRGHWLKLNFVGRRSNRRGIGTRVTLRICNDVFMYELSGGTSYCVSHEPTLVFGLGDRAERCGLEIHWPSGIRQAIDDVAVDQELRITEPLDELHN